MTTSFEAADAHAVTAFISQYELAERWGVSLRTVQRRLGQADLEPIGVVNRAPHFYREAVESAEHIYGWRPGPSNFSRKHTWRPYRLCIAHRKGGVAKTTTTYYLGRELVLLGKSVVLRDLDVDFGRK